MKLATIEFHLVETDVPDIPGGPGKYIECHLVYPPVDFAIGVGVSLAEAFANLQARVLDTATLGALQAYESQSTMDTVGDDFAFPGENEPEDIEPEGEP